MQTTFVMIQDPGAIGRGCGKNNSAKASFCSNGTEGSDTSFVFALNAIANKQAICEQKAPCELNLFDVVPLDGQDCKMPLDSISEDKSAEIIQGKNLVDNFIERDKEVNRILGRKLGEEIDGKSPVERSYDNTEGKSLLWKLGFDIEKGTEQIEKGEIDVNKGVKQGRHLEELAQSIRKLNGSDQLSDKSGENEVINPKEERDGKAVLLKNGSGLDRGKEGIGKEDATSSENQRLASRIKMNANGRISDQQVINDESIKTDLVSKTRLNSHDTQEISANLNKNVANQVPAFKSEYVPQSIKAMTMEMNNLNGNFDRNTVVKIDPDKGEGAVLSSNSQSSPKIPQALTSTKEAEGIQKPLKAEALTQVIEKAVLNLKSGQSTVNINLKPEFLGRLRLKISVENNHVILRIITEVPVVKELIESNMNNLKLDLQNNGLELDKSDVFVAKDPGQHPGTHDNAETLWMEDESDITGEAGGFYSEEKDETVELRKEGEETNGIDLFA